MFLSFCLRGSLSLLIEEIKLSGWHYAHAQVPESGQTLRKYWSCDWTNEVTVCCFPWCNDFALWVHNKSKVKRSGWVWSFLSVFFGFHTVRWVPIASLIHCIKYVMQSNAQRDRSDRSVDSYVSLKMCQQPTELSGFFHSRPGNRAANEHTLGLLGSYALDGQVLFHYHASPTVYSHFSMRMPECLSTKIL